MKKVFLSIIIATLCNMMIAQVPESFNYQAIPRNASGGTYPDQAMKLRISILSDSPSGSSVYTETFSQTTTSLGLLNLQIGKGTPVSGSFTTINWGTGSYYLKVEIDPTGGTSYLAMGTTQLLSVPYAMYSKTTQTADYNNLTNLPTLNISNWNTAYSWGNHTGLYRTISWVPTWTDVIGKPGFATVATSGSYNDLTNKPTLLNSQWTTSGSNIYYNSGNVGIGTSNPATYIHAHGSPVASRGQLSLSSPAGQDIFLSFYEANTFKSYLWFNVADQDLRLQNFTAGDLNLNPYGGNVGIGTNTPGYTLDVSGNINFTGTFYYNGGLFPAVMITGNQTISGIKTFNNDVLVNGLTLGRGAGSVSSNTACGYQAIYKNTTGYLNTAIGYESLYSNTSGTSNTAIGGGALKFNTTGNANTASGAYALIENTTGRENTASGYGALRDNTIGYSNTANGTGALNSSTTGICNTAAGTDALVYNTTGNYNTAVGYYTLYNNTTGSYNTVLGSFASLSVGSSNLTNATAIGANSAVNASNKVRIGASSVTVIEGPVNWSVGSDIRLKDNIQYSDKLGLEFVNELKTATFTYKNDSTKRHHDGLIAQDVNKALNQLGLQFSGIVENDNEEKTLNLSYAEFVIPLINSVKELSNKNKEQQKQIDELKVLVNNLLANQTVQGNK